MKKFVWKKGIIACLSLMLAFGSAAIATACVTPNSNDTSSSASVEEPIEQATLTLNTYSVTLCVGESYTITPTKKDGAGNEQAIESMNYEIENQAVASFSDNVITALAKGETHITITADGMDVACYVKVIQEVQQDGLAIRFSENQLYVGVKSSAYVYATKDGVSERLTNVTWTVDDNLSITSDGVVTPKAETDSAKITAKGMYNGEEYTLETTIKVTLPVNYFVSRGEVKVATLKTYSGETNTKCLSNSFCIYEYNPLTGMQKQVSGENLEIETESEAYKLTEAADGTITIESKSETSMESFVYVFMKEQNRRIRVKVSVANAISTIEDLDQLALAPLVSPDDLSASYVMTNDIDYAGETLYQIAPWQESASGYRPGVYWKYLLDKTNEGYELVDRANVGKEGYGLTDGEFLTFAGNKGINPLNKPFSGKFDGNGYAIKNAKLMHGAHFIMEIYEFSGAINMFGYTVGATIVNTSFDFSVQSPEETPEGVNLHRLLIGGALVDKELKRQNGRWLFSGSSLVFRALNTTIENVYIDLDLNTACQANRSAGGLIGWSTDCVMRNNVVNLVNNVHYTKYTFSLRGAGNVGIEENNLGLGTQNGMIWNAKSTEWFADHNGQDGNWFATTNEWTKLLQATKGGSTTNVVALENVIASFDTSIWDMSKFNATDGGAPTLRNGCSIPLS